MNPTTHTTRVAREEVGAEEWDAFVAASDDAWLWHRYDFLSTLATWPVREEASFALRDPGGALVAVVPAHILHGRRARVWPHRECDSFGGPAFASDLSPKL